MAGHVDALSRLLLDPRVDPNARRLVRGYIRIVDIVYLLSISFTCYRISLEFAQDGITPIYDSVIARKTNIVERLLADPRVDPCAASKVRLAGDKFVDYFCI